MTKIKLCGLSRPEDIEAANALAPACIGFVFAKKSRRYISPEKAGCLKQMLSANIQAVGVFVQEKPEVIAALLNAGIIDAAQLHGGESDDFIRQLRALSQKPLLQAFSIKTPSDVDAARESLADLILLDSGTGGTGTAFDWRLLENIRRPYFLAGGLTPQNVGDAIRLCRPYGVDVSSGVETNGKKDIQKMAAFTAAVRKEDRL